MKSNGSTTRSMEMVRAEHAQLQRVIHDMGELANHLLGQPGPAAYRALDCIIDVLEEHATVHMTEEERTLYPAVAHDLGGPMAIATMMEDHREIRRWVERLHDDRHQLETAPAPQVERVRRALYALAALLELHLRKEDLIYLPALRRRR